MRPLFLLVVCACGRLGFDPLAGGDDTTSNLAIVDVQPAWAMPSGGPIEVELAGVVDGAIVHIDGVDCAAPSSPAPTIVRCTAPAHAPATVEITATNAAGDDARFAKRFSYVTPGMYQLGGPLDDRTSGIAVDRDGNVYVTGATNGDLDGTNAGDYDALLIKYDASGTVAWIRQLGTPLWDYARDVAVDPSGDVTIVGYGTGDIDNDGTFGGVNDIFVARYSPAGDLKWVAQAGTPGDDQAWDLAVDDAGFTVVAGRTDNAFAGATSAGATDYAILRFTPAGALDWVRQVGTAADDFGHSIATAPDGTAFLVGYTAGALESSKPNAGMMDLFVARYEVDGTRGWIRQRGTAAADVAQDATVDFAGDVWVAGYTGGALDGNPFAGGQDVFVMRYDAAGAWQLTRQYGSAASENSWGVSVAPAGQVYLSCVTNGAFGGQTNAGGTEDFCMVALDRGGTHQWTRIIGTSSYEGSSSCAVDAGRTGFVYISLITDTSLDGQPNRGGNDVAVAKLDPLGVLR